MRQNTTSFIAITALPFLLSAALCFTTIFDHFYTVSPLEETVHYTVRLGHGTYTSIPENSAMTERVIAEIEEELNVKITVVDNFVYEAPVEVPGLMWPVLECKGQGELHAKDAKTGHADLTICFGQSIIGGMAAGVAVPGLGTMVAHVWQENREGETYTKSQLDTMSINTIKHEIGHLLGCEHARRGVMFWRTRMIDYENVGKFSNESIRQVKKFHKGTKEKSKKSFVDVVRELLHVRLYHK